MGKEKAEPTPGLFSKSEEAWAFLFSGRASFNLKYVATGESFSYRMTRAKEEAGKQWRPWFLSASPLEGSGKDEYLGRVLEVEPGTATPKPGLVLSDKSPERTDPRILAFLWSMDIIGAAASKGADVPPAINVEHRGKCGVCRRILIHPRSVELGIGQDCRLKT